jgi:hypothetical protein
MEESMALNLAESRYRNITVTESALKSLFSNCRESLPPPDLIPPLLILGIPLIGTCARAGSPVSSKMRKNR